MGKRRGTAPARHPVARPRAGTASGVPDVASSAASTPSDLVSVRGAARPWEFFEQLRAHMARAGGHRPRNAGPDCRTPLATAHAAVRPRRRPCSHQVARARPRPAPPIAPSVSTIPAQAPANASPLERCGAQACCPTPRRGRSINYMWRTAVLRHGSHATSPASPSAPGHAAQQRSVPIPVNPFRFPCAPPLSPIVCSAARSSAPRPNPPPCPAPRPSPRIRGLAHCDCTLSSRCSMSLVPCCTLVLHVLHHAVPASRAVLTFRCLQVAHRTINTKHRRTAGRCLTSLDIRSSV